MPLFPGFAKDIGATSNDVNDAVSLFFITFVIFQPISAAAGRLVGPKYWMPFLMVGPSFLLLSDTSTDIGFSQGRLGSLDFV